MSTVTNGKMEDEANIDTDWDCMCLSLSIIPKLKVLIFWDLCSLRPLKQIPYTHLNRLMVYCTCAESHHHSWNCKAWFIGKHVNRMVDPVVWLYIVYCGPGLIWRLAQVLSWSAWYHCLYGHDLPEECQIQPSINPKHILTLFALSNVLLCLLHPKAWLCLALCSFIFPIRPLVCWFIILFFAASPFLVFLWPILDNDSLLS
jgi:hypothetical protein